MRDIFLSICAIFLCVFASAQTPKKIVIDGGAAPTLFSQLTNDIDLIDLQTLSDSIAALRAEIDNFVLTFAGDDLGGLEITNAETFLISGGSGLLTTASGNNVEIRQAWNELGIINSGEVDGTDYLLLQNENGPRRVLVSEFESQLPSSIIFATDAGIPASLATISIGETYNFKGTGGIRTNWTAGTSSLTVEFDPFDLLSDFAAQTNDYVLTFDGSNLGRTLISSLPTNTYSFTIQADDNESDVISSGEVVDFESGLGLISSIEGTNDVRYALDFHNLGDQTPSTTDKVLWFTNAGQYKEVEIGNLPISSGGGDITGVTAGTGIGGGGTSGSVSLFLALNELTDADNNGDGRDRVPVRSHNNSLLQRQISFHDLLQGTLVAGSGISLGYSGNDSQVTITSTASTPAWSSITGIPAGFADNIDNQGLTGVVSNGTGIDLSISGGVNVDADLDIPGMEINTVVTEEDKLAVYTARGPNGSTSTAGHYEATIYTMMVAGLKAGSGISFAKDASDGRLRIDASGGSGDITAVTTSSPLSGGATSGTANISVNEGVLLDNTVVEDEIIFSENLSGAFSGDTRRLLWTVGTPFGSGYTITIPDPDTAPEGAIIDVMMYGTFDVTFDIPGTTNEMYDFSNGINLNKTNSIDLVLGLYRFVLMPDPDNSSRVWAVIRQGGG